MEVLNEMSPNIQTEYYGEEEETKQDDLDETPSKIDVESMSVSVTTEKINQVVDLQEDIVEKKRER